MCTSGWLRWVIPRPAIVLTCFMCSCSTQKIGSTFPQQPASGRSSLWLLLSGYLGLLYPPWFNPQGCGRRVSGYHTGHWNHFALTVDAPPGDHLEGVTLWHSCISGSVHNSPCHKRTTMGSRRALMGDGEANLPILLQEATQALSPPCHGKTLRKLSGGW